MTGDHPPYTFQFQLTPSRRATINLPPLALRSLISTHALTEGDFKTIKRWSIDYHFNSRPHGGRPNRYGLVTAFVTFQLTPSRRATTRAVLERPQLLYFNSRPHGGRLVDPGVVGSTTEFQLTPSRRATRKAAVTFDKFTFQLTPSRRATYRGQCFAGKTAFQLTPSRRATGISVMDYRGIVFQLTPSRRATTAPSDRRNSRDISTHALTEGDSEPARHLLAASHFNSRPHGGRLERLEKNETPYEFQLTPSRRATGK